MKKIKEIFSDCSREQILLAIALIEYLMFIVSGTSFSFLHDMPFFNFGVDPIYWFLFLTKIPHLINSHQWIGITLDTCVLLMFIYMISKKGKSRLAFPLFTLLLIYYITLTSFLGHRNYQSGFVIILIPFLFQTESNRAIAYELVRYFLLFFYFSAAIIKMVDFHTIDISHLSNYLQQQFTAYYLEGNTGWRTTVNSFLITNKQLSFELYLTAICIEFITIIGFFTKRIDIWIGISLIIFHLASWIIMDIAPIGQLAFIYILFCKNQQVKTF